jgi:uncharacterized protein YqjF (DUF2071 family)
MRRLPMVDLDRVAPAQREACRTRPTGRQTWNDLLFLHWEIPVDLLRRVVPAALTIDTHEGRAYVGVVPFTMRDVRFGPVALADFLETNVRTYVHAEGVPGVWFLSLDAESILAVLGGRTLFRLPYYRARMACTRTRSPGSVDYRMTRGGAGDAALDVQWTYGDEDAFHARVGSLEHFLTERYALYGSARESDVYRVRVHHGPWPLRKGKLAGVTTTLLTAAGLPGGDPIDLVLASPEGVAVQTFARERVGR